MGKGEHLGELEELIMLCVLSLGGDAYGAGIRRRLRRDAGRSVSVSSIYVTLMRLEEKGLVRSAVGEGRPGHPGRPRRVFELTASGLEAVGKRRGVRERLWESAREPGRAG